MNGLSILTLFVVKSASHHGMPTIRLKTSNFEGRQLRKNRQPKIDFLVDFWGLRDPSIYRSSQVDPAAAERWTPEWALQLKVKLQRMKW